MISWFAGRASGGKNWALSISVGWLLLSSLATGIEIGRIVCDADSDCFYVPSGITDNEVRPVLLILSCTGAVPHDLDSNLIVAESLGWLLVSCHRARNHRDPKANDRDIIRTLGKLLASYPADPCNIYICGFSGMGSQALYELVAHPDLIHGVIAACAPYRPAPILAPDALHGRAVYLVSREHDWNLEGNHYWRDYFRRLGAEVELVVTSGQHEPGDAAELLTGCRWAYRNSE